MKTVIHTDNGGSLIVRPLPSGRVNIGMISGATGIGAPLTAQQCDDAIQALTVAKIAAEQYAQGGRA